MESLSLHYLGHNKPGGQSAFKGVDERRGPWRHSTKRHEPPQEECVTVFCSVSRKKYLEGLFCATSWGTLWELLSGAELGFLQMCSAAWGMQAGVDQGKPGFGLLLESEQRLEGTQNPTLG